MFVPNRRSRFVMGSRRCFSPGERQNEEWHWRQVLDWLDAHIVDHGGSLWVWETDGYKWVPEGCMGETIFYNLKDIYES